MAEEAAAKTTATEDCSQNMDFPSEMDGSQWEEHFWKGDFLPWAMELEPDKFIVKYFDALGSQGRKDLKVFFPMCGATPDMKWVADQGHKVIGCEYAKSSGSLFGKNMNLTYSESVAPDLDGLVFEYKEADIKLYACDIFKFSSELEGQFDIIWDSAAFVAVNQKEKQKYADLMASLLKPDGKFFLYGIDYPDGVIKGPPFQCRNEHVKQFFSAFNSEYVDDHTEEEEYDGIAHKFVHGLRSLTFK